MAQKTAARNRNVAILSGASSTPALSHAALDVLTSGWKAIDTVRVAICPGNRTGRGPYVPTLTALALIRRFRDGALDFRGAQPCVGILSLDDFQADFDRLGFKTEIRYNSVVEKHEPTRHSKENHHGFGNRQPHLPG